MVLERPNNDGEILTAAEKLPPQSLEVTGRWLITAMIKVETTLVDEKGRLKATQLVKLQRIVETLAVVSKVLIPAAKERYQQLVSNLGLFLQDTINAPPEDHERVRHDFNMITSYTLQAIQLGASALLTSDAGEHSPGAATWVTLENSVPTFPGDDEDRSPVDPSLQDRPPEASPFI
jgi:hypothetical protein